MKLLLATRNPGKATEVKELLSDTDWEVVTLDGVAPKLVVKEDGKTFEANARKKAKQAAKASGLWALADDSGLEVDALDGEPGVLSARYGGPQASDADRSRLVLNRLVAVPDERRTARFKCVICLAEPGGQAVCFEGSCEGRIAYHRRGHGGFGYDPIFIPDGHSRTFAELGIEVKNKLSHRARALAKAVEYLRKHGSKPKPKPARKRSR